MGGMMAAATMGGGGGIGWAPAAAWVARMGGRMGRSMGGA